MRENIQPGSDERDERDDLARLALSLTSELPDPADRAALAAAIRDGAVEDVYRPFGADFHNATLPDVPPWVDPRVRVSEWAALTRAGHDVRAVWIERAAAAVERQGA